MTLSKTQLKAMDSLLAMDGEGDVKRTLDDCRITTIEALRKTGMLHCDIKYPTTWAAAHRIRQKLYWLTTKGKETVRRYRAKKKAKFDALMTSCQS